MIYKGYSIELERQICEVWELDDNGDTSDYAYDCGNPDHQRFAEYVAFTEEDKRLVSGETLEAVKAYIDDVDARP